MRAPATYAEAKAVRDAIDAEGREAGKVLNAFPKGAMNLTPDAVKATPEWKAAKARSDALFQKLRTFNTWFVKAFAAEIRAERRSRGR